MKKVTLTAGLITGFILAMATPVHAADSAFISQKAAGAVDVATLDQLLQKRTTVGMVRPAAPVQIKAKPIQTTNNNYYVPAQPVTYGW